MQYLNLIVLSLLFFSCTKVTQVSLNSPDRKTEVTLSTGESGIIYSVMVDGDTIINRAGLGFLVQNGVVLGDDARIVSFSESGVNETWKPVYGERSEVINNYNQITVHLKENIPEKREYEITFRAYNEGVAFNTTFLPGEGSDSLKIEKELTSFRFLDDYNSWVSDRAQSEYRKVPISSIEQPAERPLVIETAGKMVAIGEAGLIRFARMKLVKGESMNTLISSLDGEPSVPLPFTTPWRTIMTGDSPGELLENNFFYENLNDPCQIEDVSWIKPGKVIREVTLTTIGGKACVDFAAANGLQYVEFDAGWYGPEYDSRSDATTVTVDPGRSPGPLDLHEVIRYAEEKGVGIIVYVNRRALEKQLDEILPLYRKWGIKGVKYGFVQVGSQKWTTWLHEAVRKAAENKLMVDIHDEYRPTGYSRTYPNLMTQEGIRGDEESPSNTHTLITLFTRMLAGAGDNTNCYYAPRVTQKMGGHVSQLAKSVMIYSPWQFLFWYDRPKGSPGKKGGAGSSDGTIRGHKELEFFRHLPVVWDQSIVLEGEIGKYATIVRRSGEEWYLGSLTGDEGKKVKMHTDFLEQGIQYEATVYAHDPSFSSGTGVKIDKMDVDRNSELLFEIKDNSGLAIRFSRK